MAEQKVYSEPGKGRRQCPKCKAEGRAIWVHGRRHVCPVCDYQFQPAKPSKRRKKPQKPQKPVGTGVNAQMVKSQAPAPGDHIGNVDWISSAEWHPGLKQCQRCKRWVDEACQACPVCDTDFPQEPQEGHYYRLVGQRHLYKCVRGLTGELVYENQDGCQFLEAEGCRIRREATPDELKKFFHAEPTPAPAEPTPAPAEPTPAPAEPVSPSLPEEPQGQPSVISCFVCW